MLDVHFVRIYKRSQRVTMVFRFEWEREQSRKERAKYNGNRTNRMDRTKQIDGEQNKRINERN